MKMSISRLSKSLSMGTSSRMMMSTSIRMTMKMNTRMENLDNFFDGSLRVCKRDLALDAQKLNKPERCK